MKNLDFYVQSTSFQIHLCLLQNLVLKVTYLHCSMVLEHIVVLLVDPSPDPVSTPLLASELEIMAIS